MEEAVFHVQRATLSYAIRPFSLKARQEPSLIWPSFPAGALQIPTLVLP